MRAQQQNEAEEHTPQNLIVPSSEPVTTCRHSALREPIRGTGQSTPVLQKVWQPVCAGNLCGLQIAPNTAQSPTPALSAANVDSQV